MPETPATDSAADWVPADTFGARLALIRQHHGWNVKEAADACGLVDQSWSNWEAGTSPRDYQNVCDKIARGSRADLVWLMMGGALRTESFATLSLVPAVLGDQSLLDPETGEAYNFRDDRKPELTSV
jgi:transcriptional regulator with XRE-family HTH domain